MLPCLSASLCCTVCLPICMLHLSCMLGLKPNPVAVAMHADHVSPNAHFMALQDLLNSPSGVREALQLLYC